MEVPLPQQRDSPTPPLVRGGLILKNAECLRSAVQPQLLLSSDSAQPSAFLNSFQPRKLLSSAGTSPAKPAASLWRLSPGWRGLFWSVCGSFYLHSELCTAPVWDGKPGSCLPDGCHASRGQAVRVRAHRPHAAAGPGIAPAALSLLVWCWEVNTQGRDHRTALPRGWDAGSRAGPVTLTQILNFPGKVQHKPSATIPGWESLSLPTQVHLVSIYSKPKSSK